MIINVRENRQEESRVDNQEWTIKEESRVDNQGGIKSGQSGRNQEWTIKRHKTQEESRVDNQETQDTEGIKSGQSRETRHRRNQ